MAKKNSSEGPIAKNGEPDPHLAHDGEKFIEFGRMEVLVCTIDLQRRCLAGHTKEDGKNKYSSFVINKEPNYNLDLNLARLKVGDKILIGYERKKINRYNFKFVRSIVDSDIENIE